MDRTRQGPLDVVRRERPAYYESGITYDLTTAQTDLKVDKPGDFLLVELITGTVTVKFNEKENPAASLNRIKEFNTPFDRFYLTWSAQPGKTLILTVGRSAAFIAKATQQVAIVDFSGADITPAGEGTMAKLVPVAKAAIFNTAEPAAEASLLGAAIAPTNSPSFLRIYVCFSNGGIFRVARTVGGVTVVENINGGVALTAGAAYSWDIEWRTGDTINFRYSVTGGTTYVLRADEIGAAA